MVIGAIVTGCGAVTELLGIELQEQVTRWLPSFTSLGSIFALLISVTMPLAVMALTRTVITALRSGAEIKLHLIAAIILFFSITGILGARTRYEFMLYWELMTISSFVMLLWNARNRESLHAAVGYFIVMHVGFLFIFGAFMALGESKHLFGVGAMGVGTWLLFFVGFGVKSAIFPLHFWLHSTYRAANPLTAAMMSGAVTNMGIYGIVSVSYAVADMFTISYILMFFGAATALWGAMKMIGRTTIRGVLSYSSVDNIGIIVLALGVGLYGKTSGEPMVALLAIIGAMVHLFSHGVAKTLLFVSSGHVQALCSTSRLSALGGVARRMPITSGAFAVGGLSLSAIPPLGGFVGEFMILSAMLTAIAGVKGSIVGIAGIIILVLASASTVFNMNKVFGVGFLGREHSARAHRLRENVGEGGVVAYAILSTILTMGVWALLYALSMRSADIFGVTASIDGVVRSAIWICGAGLGVAAIAVGLYQLKLWLTRGRENVVMPPWSGAEKRAPRSRESVESWSGQARETFTLPTSNARSERRHRLSRIAVPAHLMRHFTARLALLQTGRTSHYVMHILLFLTLVLILTLTHAI